MIALAGALAVSYLPHILWGEFLYEDLAWIVNTEQGQLHPGWHPRGFSEAVWLWQWQLSRTPMLFHAVSVALHVVVAVLAGVFARRLGLSAAGAWIVVTIVLLHRLGTETVSYVAQQGELLAAIGVIGACVLATCRWWTLRIATGIIACVAFGILAKDSAVVVLVLVPAVIAYTTPALAVLPAAVSALLLMFGVNQFGGLSALVNLGEDGIATVSAVDWLAIQSAAVVRTFGLLVIPYGLTVDYDYDILPMALRWCAVSALAGLAVVTWLIRRRCRLEAFSVFCLLVIAAPRLIVQTPRSNFNDHQAYLFLPFFGMLVASVWERVCVGRGAEAVRDYPLSASHTGALLSNLREGTSSTVQARAGHASTTIKPAWLQRALETFSRLVCSSGRPVLRSASTWCARNKSQSVCCERATVARSGS